MQLVNARFDASDDYAPEDWRARDPLEQRYRERQERREGAECGYIGQLTGNTSTWGDPTGIEGWR